MRSPLAAGTDLKKSEAGESFLADGSASILFHVFSREGSGKERFIDLDSMTDSYFLSMDQFSMSAELLSHAMRCA